MKKVFCLILLATALIALVSCGGVSTQNNTTNITMQDRAGNTIAVPEKIEKIIVMSPSIAETLIDLGLSDKIIGIDKYSAYLTNLKSDLPQFDLMTPDTEKLITLKPDIVFMTAMSAVNGVNPFQPLIDVGICVASIPASNSIDGIKQDIDFLGKVTSTEDKANAIISNMESEIAKVKNIGDTITDKKKVYFEIAAAPELYSFGKDVFLDEMLNIIGLANVLSDQNSWIPVSEETVLNANPDIIFTNVNYLPNDPVEEIKSRSGWQNISAVKNNQVFYIDNNQTSHSNEYIVTALKEMAKDAYPEKYSDLK
ncbi:MAG: ABC transporter substrate-binding protein [Oscillospiraceae bacterium]|nr:ABC transporter substrate-binding protein [Oscillospiraceae bacterium]